MTTCRKKILFADDSELFLELEKSIFNREGLEHLVASDGRQALSLVREHLPDLVLLDLYMPGMDGDECCRSIKKDPALKAIPVVIVTQSGRAEDLERCRLAGCDDLVPKPIDRHRLLTVASRFLNLAARGESRLPARMQIRYGAEGAELLTDYTVNLSTGGMFIETEGLLPVETPLAIEFRLPTVGPAIRCRGRVAWVNGKEKPVKSDLSAGMGIQFLDLTLADLESIREYIQKELVSGTW